jgi:hypothetical protein
MQVCQFLGAVLQPSPASKPNAAIKQLSLELQQKLMSPNVATCLVQLADCCLLPSQDASSQETLVRIYVHHTNLIWFRCFFCSLFGRGFMELAPACTLVLCNGGFEACMLTVCLPNPTTRLGVCFM